MGGIYLEYGLRGHPYNPAMAFGGMLAHGARPAAVLAYDSNTDLSETIYYMDSGYVSPDPADFRIRANVLHAKWEVLHCGAVIGRLWFPILKFSSHGRPMRPPYFGYADYDADERECRQLRTRLDRRLRAYERGADAEFDLVLDRCCDFNSRFVHEVPAGETPVWLGWTDDGRGRRRFYVKRGRA